MYIRMHLAPDGRAFVTAPSYITRFLDTTGTGTWHDTGLRRKQDDQDYGCSIMYEPGKVLVVGGGDPPRATAETIDLNVAAPAWTEIAPMKYPRRQHNATSLPDGTVLVTGGTSSPGFNDATNAVLPAELWNPTTGQWTELAAMKVPRCYHSTALLLPDGRVLSAGGGKPPATGSTDNWNAEIFSPPYLSQGKRPRISGVSPLDVAYGGSFSVTTVDAAAIAKVTLVRLSSVSHGDNMNQRFAQLTWTAVSGGLTVNAPTNRNLAPPGHYSMFFIGTNGVPSHGTTVRIG
jgi:hypothetical protein